MKRIDVLNSTGEIIGWLDCWEPSELTIKNRRRLQAAFSSTGTALKRVQDATKLALLGLGLPAGAEPTKEQQLIAAENTDVQPPLTEDEADRIMMLQQAALVATIAGWSFDKPVTRETLDNMTADEYDPIQAAAKDAAAAMLEKMQVDFEVSPPQPVSEVPTPFGASSDSATSDSGVLSHDLS